MKKLKYLLLILLVFPACKEDEAPIGHPGGLRCKVNGVEWTPEWPLIYTPFTLQYYDDIKGISISANRRLEDQSINQTISFHAEKIEVGENKIAYSKRVFKDWNVPGNCGLYDLDTLQPHVIFIESIDREKRTISGTFQFTANNFDYQVNGEVCSGTIHVTDGEFNFGF